MPDIFTLHDDISTSDPEQIAVVRTADDVFILNFATVSATMATAIRVEGHDARISNFGTVLTAAPMQAGIRVFGDGFTIANHGTVEAAGQPSSGILATGNGGVVHNFGVVRALTAGSRGMIVTGSENCVDNYGTIATAGTGSVTYQSIGADNVTVNHGTITAFSAGAACVLSGTDNELINHGLIENELGRGARLTGGDNLVFNDGTIQAVVAIMSNDPVARQDTVMNFGAIVGEVTLGLGDDLYVAGQGGSLDGLLVLGAGNDTVMVHQNSGTLVVADFAAGPASDDVLAFGAFAAKDLDDVLAVSTQDGSDVVIEVGPNATVVLQDVLLADLSADDFDFAAAGPAAADIPFV